jgi:hypothetical protein
MMHDDTSTDEAAGALDATEQDPTVEENLGAGPAPTEDREDTGAAEPGAEDIPPAPAGPGATPADPDQPLNPA